MTTFTDRIVGSALDQALAVRADQPLTMPPGTVSWLQEIAELESGGSRGLVGTLFRAIDLRAKYVSNIPFEIVTESGDIVDSSERYENALGFMPRPKRLLMLTEMSNASYGAAYFKKVTSGGSSRPLVIRHIPASTMKPHITSEEGLAGFKRTVNGRSKTLTRDEVLWTFAPDEDVELGPAQKTPVRAAASAANVLLSIDDFAKKYFARGAVKATLLSASGMRKPEERAALERWWTAFMQGGMSRVFQAKVVNADKVSATVVGGGIEEVDRGTISKDRQHEIATATGVPYSLLFGDTANRAVSEREIRNFYEGVLIPAVEIVQEDWNPQLFVPLGFRLVFRPQRLKVFQQEENERSASWLNYTRGGMRPSVAAQLLGLDLPADIEFEDLDEGWDQGAALSAPVTSATGTTRHARREELKTLHRRALSTFRAGESLHFDAELLDRATVAAVEAAHSSARSEDQINGHFDDLFADYP